MELHWYAEGGKGRRRLEREAKEKERERLGVTDFGGREEARWLRRTDAILLIDCGRLGVLREEWEHIS
jgi:hypothetical protein